jgi:large subunit ribosomal protein L31
MKAGIHPKVKKCAVKCTCGNSFEILSERESMSVDLCSECHPFYTGQQKMIDSAGRVDKFAQRYAAKLSLDKLAKRDTTKAKDLSKLAFKFNPKAPKAPTRPVEEKGEGDKAGAKPGAKGGAKAKK